MSRTSTSMLPDSDGNDRVNCFAVVSYITGALGAFVDQFQREAGPCRDVRAHVTILPPRPLRGTLAAASAHVEEHSRHFGAFEIEATRVRTFRAARVIYLDVGAGAAQLRRLNRRLNSGAWRFTDPYSYHPHITLAQELPEDRVPEVRKLARKRWAEDRLATRFAIDRISLVQYTRANRWVDVAEYGIGRPG
ncbi:MAG: 2'-5' RNA ligase family protein [Bryobacterales bacterium]|nr:2'-5' RNA ligase family protein [Bryobacterales bacterium]